jgi:hypothetical protein
MEIDDPPQTPVITPDEDVLTKEKGMERLSGYEPVDNGAGPSQLSDNTHSVRV